MSKEPLCPGPQRSAVKRVKAREKFLKPSKLFPLCPRAAVQKGRGRTEVELAKGGGEVWEVCRERDRAA